MNNIRQRRPIIRMVGKVLVRKRKGGERGRRERGRLVTHDAAKNLLNVELIWLHVRYVDITSLVGNNSHDDHDYRGGNETGFVEVERQEEHRTAYHRV